MQGQILCSKSSSAEDLKGKNNMSIKKFIAYVLRISLFFVFVSGFYTLGSSIMVGKLPAAESEPGLEA